MSALPSTIAAFWAALKPRCEAWTTTGVSGSLVFFWRVGEFSNCAAISMAAMPHGSSDMF
jgi:hypothetical protein